MPDPSDIRMAWWDDSPVIDGVIKELPPAMLMPPATPQDNLLQTAQCVAEVQALLRSHAQQGRHPLPLFQAFLQLIATHADDLAAPGLSGHAVIDAMCMQLRGAYSAVQAQRQQASNG